MTPPASKSMGTGMGAPAQKAAAIAANQARKANGGGGFAPSAPSPSGPIASPVATPAPAPLSPPAPPVMNRGPIMPAGGRIVNSSMDLGPTAFAPKF